jgi:hypothetical protein
MNLYLAIKRSWRYFMPWTWLVGRKPIAEADVLPALRARLRLAVRINLIASAVLAVLNFVILWPVPRGSNIMPMGLNLLNLLVCAIVLLRTSFVSIKNLWLGRHDRSIWFLASLAFGLGFLPLLAFDGLWTWVINAHNLQLGG